MVVMVLSKIINMSKFYKNIYNIAIGTIIAQLIQFITLPILSRLYNPTDFGYYALFNVFSSVLAVFATAKYEIAIFLPKSHDEAKDIAVYAMILTILTSFFILIGLIFVKNPIGILFKLPLTSIWFIISLVIQMGLIGIHQIFICWLSRKEKYKTISLNLILRAFIVSMVSTMLSLQNVLPHGLILGSIIGQFFATIVIIFSTKPNVQNHIRNITIEKIKYVAIKYSGFAIFSFPGELIRTLATSVPIMVLAAYFGNLVVGNYNQAQRIIFAPLSTAGYAVADVYRQQAAIEWNTNEECSRIFRQVFWLIVIIFSPIYLLIWIYSPDFIPFILGPQWTIAGNFARILIPLAFLSLMATILGRTNSIAHKLKEDAIWQIAYLFIITISLLYGSESGDVNNALALFTLFSSLFYIIYISKCYHFSKGKIEISPMQ